MDWISVTTLHAWHPMPFASFKEWIVIGSELEDVLLVFVAPAY
jgi:hypothetical protein